MKGMLFSFNTHACAGSFHNDSSQMITVYCTFVNGCMLQLSFLVLFPDMCKVMFAVVYISVCIHELMFLLT